MPVTFRTIGGGDPEQLVLRLRGAAQPNIGDALHAGQILRTRILQRTARGVDVSGAAFKPYSTTGPYYWYPGRAAKNARGAAARTAKKIGRAGSVTGGGGIRFSSYADFKRALGRSGVDLRGPRAPHMLQAIVVRSGGVELGRLVNLLNPGRIEATNPQPAREVTIGIYGDEAKRATAHNVGSPGRLQPRHFFGANQQDARLMLADMAGRIQRRLQQVVRGAS